MCLVSICGHVLSISSFLSSTDKVRLKQVFAGALDSKDLPAVHYAVLGYNLLKEAVPKSQVGAFVNRFEIK